MATRKSGDGSRGADEAGVSPGSYAKVSGSRRKRKKKGRSMPPSAPPSGATAILTGESPRDDLEDVVDTEGVDTSDVKPGRRTEPDWGAARSDERDLSVDDLRRKPTSSRAPRKPHGPLGMEDAPSEPPSQAELRAHGEAANVPGLGAEQPRETARKISSPLPPAPASGSGPPRMRVIEINPPESENTNALWGDDEDEQDESDEFPLGSAAARPRDGFHGTDSTRKGFNALDGVRSAVDRQSQQDQDDDDEEVGRLLEERLRESNLPAPRHSFSSVLGARPSLRPSPPPPPEKVSLLWWLMVTLLSSIIIAAGVIAFREAMHKGERAAAPEQPEPVAPGPSEPSPSEPSPYDVRKAPSSNGQNSATITSAPSVFPSTTVAVDTPPAAPAKAPEPPAATAAPSNVVVKPAGSVSPAQPAPIAATPTPTPTTAVRVPAPTPVPARPAVVAAPAARPSPHPAPRPRAAAAAAAAPAAPAPPAPAVEAPAPATAPEIERPIGAVPPAPVPDPRPLAPEEPPLHETRLPINPYAE